MMELWQIVLVVGISIIVGVAAAILVSKKVLSPLIWGVGKNPESPEGSTVIKHTGDEELYQGLVKLDITTPKTLRYIDDLQAHLGTVPDLHLVSVGGSAAGNTVVVIRATSPLPLPRILREMPEVKSAVAYGNTVKVTFKAD